MAPPRPFQNPNNSGGVYDVPLLHRGPEQCPTDTILKFVFEDTLASHPQKQECRLAAENLIPSFPCSLGKSPRYMSLQLILGVTVLQSPLFRPF
jgi:hypothetical protein